MSLIRAPETDCELCAHLFKGMVSLLLKDVWDGHKLRNCVSPFRRPPARIPRVIDRSGGRVDVGAQGQTGRRTVRPRVGDVVRETLHSTAMHGPVSPDCGGGEMVKQANAIKEVRGRATGQDRNGSAQTKKKQLQKQDK